MNIRQQDAELLEELEKRWQIDQKKHTQEVNDKIQQFKHECERMVKNRYAIENEKLILLSSRFEQTEKKFKVTCKIVLLKIIWRVFTFRIQMCNC